MAIAASQRRFKQQSARGVIEREPFAARQASGREMMSAHSRRSDRVANPARTRVGAKGGPCLRPSGAMECSFPEAMGEPPPAGRSTIRRGFHCHTLIVFSRHKLHLGCPARRLEHIAGVCSSGRCGPSSPTLARAFAASAPGAQQPFRTEGPLKVSPTSAAPSARAQS
jgi:hypothetical protein